MATTPITGRVPGLILGILLLGWGGRLYRVFVLLPGLVGGVWVAATVRPMLGMSTNGSLVLGAILAALGAVACHFMESIAIRLTGAILGAGISAWLWPLFSPARLPWYLPVGCALLLALIFPRIYRAALVPITALFGAQLVAWCLGHATSAPVIVGLWLAGCVTQYMLGKKSKD